MSFDRSRFKGFSSGSRKGTLFHYTTPDSLATVVTSSYFNEAFEDVNDLSTVLVGCETGEMATLLIRRVGSSLVVVSQISAAAASNVPVTAEKIGLPVDGTTNVATLLGSDMAIRSAAGGAVYELNPGSGLFYINSALEIPSNITLRMSGADVLHGPNGQVIIKGQVSSSSIATLSANWTKGSDTGTVTTVPSWLVKNAWVVLEDAKVAGDVSGSSTERIRREIRQVISVTSTTVVLNGPARRTYETSYSAVLRRFVPVRNSSVHNWRVKFVEPSSDSLVHTLMLDGAVDCNFTDCHVLNETEHGSRGNAFRVQLSYNSGLVNPIVRNPKYTGAGEGYGVHFQHSTLCWADDIVSYGCRHNLTFAGSTDVTVRGATLGGDRFSSVETRGSNNVGIEVNLTRISDPGDSLGAGNTAIVFGHEEALAGDHECIVRGGVIENYSGSTAKIVSFRPPSTKCGIRNIVLYKCSQLFHHTDQEDDGDLIAEDCYVEDIRVFEHDNEDYLAYCDGGYFGSSVKTLKNFRMSNVVVDKFGQGMRFIQANGIKLENVRLSNQLSDIGDKFSFKFEDVTGLKVIRPVMDKPQWGISLASTPNAVILWPVFWDVQNATPLILDAEDGTCDGTVFKHWQYDLTVADAVISATDTEVTVEPPVGYAYLIVEE